MDATTSTHLTASQRVAKFESLLTGKGPLPESHFFDLQECRLQILKIDAGNSVYGVCVDRRTATENGWSYYYDRSGNMTNAYEGTRSNMRMARSPDALISQADKSNEWIKAAETDGLDGVSFPR